MSYLVLPKSVLLSITHNLVFSVRTGFLLCLMLRIRCDI